MITSTICLDEPKFYLNLVNFDVVVYVTHSANANNMTEKKKRQFGIEPAYHTLYMCSRVVPKFIYLLTWQFCVKMVY